MFLGGLYFYTKYATKYKMLEGLTTINGEMRCPNLLIQKGSKYYLYNSNKSPYLSSSAFIFFICNRKQSKSRVCLHTQ